MNFLIQVDSPSYPHIILKIVALSLVFAFFAGAAVGHYAVPKLIKQSIHVVTSYH